MLLTLAVGVSAPGCAASLVDNPSERCESNLECSAGRTCLNSFCVVDSVDRDAAIDLAVGAIDLGTPAADLGTGAAQDLGTGAAQDLGTDAAQDLGTDAAQDLGVVVATDLGVDLGVTSRDLGVVTPRDLGVAPTDLGAAPRDLGAAPRDLGVAPTDLGAAPRDLGVAPRDLGTDAGEALPCSGRDDTRCGMFCVDLDDNFLNCGACGRSCSVTDRRCHRGECDP